MQEQRVNKIILLVGRRGCGKTTTGKKIANAQSKKVLVVDTFQHPSYDDFSTTTTDKLKYWKSGNYRVFDKEPIQILLTINEHVRNSCIILEDAAKYLWGNVPAGVKGLLIDSRNRNLDIILMFHNLADIPPYIAKMYNDMVLYKTNDNMSKEMSKFSNWGELKKHHERIMKNKSPYANGVIKMQ